MQFEIWRVYVDCYLVILLATHILNFVSKEGNINFGTSKNSQYWIFQHINEIR